MKKKLIPKVVSLYDLRQKAAADPRYERLALSAARNLGGDAKNLNDAIRWLEINMLETDEDGVINEINFVRDCI